MQKIAGMLFLNLFAQSFHQVQDLAGLRHGRRRLAGYDFFLPAGMPSSVVRYMSYDAERHVLRIGYVSGNTYDYLGVPVEIYEGMKAAGSKGEFLNREIKGKYRFERVK